MLRADLPGKIDSTKVESYINFTILSMDTLIAGVSITEDGVVTIQRYTDNPLKQVFPRKHTTIMEVYNFMKSRCYEDGRADLKQILAQAGMESNNPWEWCKLTHGVTFEDFYWIRYEGEDISWDDLAMHHRPN